jgi:hypothetical protein
LLADDGFRQLPFEPLGHLGDCLARDVSFHLG